MAGTIPAAAAAKAGLSWQTIALVLAAAGASTGGSLAVSHSERARPVEVAQAPELEARVHALEDAQHRAEVAAAARDAHLDEQLAAIRETLQTMRAEVRAMQAPRGGR